MVTEKLKTNGNIKTKHILLAFDLIASSNNHFYNIDDINWKWLGVLCCNFLLLLHN